ncbi:patatin-like phospholipase family protein [Jeotgalibacillus sp. R-1-5s-1]|uniref:patatin-like phospholipase family protein n=1 Tax=Jeotgalibacillus sp. R-1-5s-1 TaxID=2555897 RepID=UPI00106DC8EA|nr:patatin-like phospholipase family protein [Jeotgalibacillus sp. R-1-5s-1]TFE03595.1 patatin family protein [Jeotgalibacillus sp. R-1-5s-1]
MKPKIGLALGSGGSRGFAHLGVLKVLEREGIQVDYLAGSSMGSLVGALYSAGHDIDDLYRLAGTFRNKYFMDLTVPRMGFIQGEKFKQFVRLFTHSKNIEDLNIPLSIVATDIIKAERVIFTKGPIDTAVRASTSIPGIFVPEKSEGRLLVDGGVIDRVPSAVCRDMGADIVIGVDVSQVKKNAEINTIYDVIMQSIDILQTEIVHLKSSSANILISPKVEQFSGKTFQYAKEIIKLGEESAEASLQDIITEIERWKEYQAVNE